MKFRKNIRLKDYDYSTNGYYFVTVVTKNRLPLLCSSGCKSTIEECIKNMPEFISGLSVDWFVVIDNHIHIIFVFENCSRTLSRVVAAMKSAITKIVAADVSPQAVDLLQFVGLRQPLQIWQWNYYEHIIRNEKALDKIRRYIQNNPDIEKYDWDKLENVAADVNPPKGE